MLSENQTSEGARYLFFDVLVKYNLLPTAIISMELSGAALHESDLILIGSESEHLQFKTDIFLHIRSWNCIDTKKKIIYNDINLSVDLQRIIKLKKHSFFS